MLIEMPDARTAFLEMVMLASNLAFPHSFKMLCSREVDSVILQETGRIPSLCTPLPAGSTDQFGSERSKPNL